VAKLVFDIETSALPVDNFDEVQQEYLFRDAEKLPDEAARDAKRTELEQFMSLWPFTSQVVCIAMLNAESSRGQVLFLAEDFEDAAENDQVEFIPCADETELLTAFWDVAKHYDEVVTFNGRGFDVPLRPAQCAHLPEELARLPLRHRTALRPRRAIDVLQRERARRRGAEVQPGFLLQGLRHRIAQEPRRDGHGRERFDGRRKIPRDRRILPARRESHRAPLPSLERTARRDQITAETQTRYLLAS